MMATRQVYPTAIIYTVCSLTFSSFFVLMKRAPGLQLASVWRTFVIYQVRMDDDSTKRFWSWSTTDSRSKSIGAVGDSLLRPTVGSDVILSYLGQIVQIMI